MRTNTQSAQYFSNMARLANHLYKLFALFFIAHRRATPYGSNQASNFQIQATELIGQFFNSIVGEVNSDVRIEKTEIDTVKFNTAYIGCCSHFEHRVKINRRLRIGSFSHDTLPGSLLQFM